MREDLESVTLDHVRWAYRVLLDRLPESETVVEDWARLGLDSRELRLRIQASPEYRLKNRGVGALAPISCVVVKELATGVRLFVDLADLEIGMNVILGAYETAELAWLRTVLGPGEVAVDVGANIGFFTMHMAALVGPGGRVFAFEPQPEVRGLLERSVRENRFEDRVTVSPAAVSDRVGTSRLVCLDVVAAGNSGGSYLSTRSDALPTGHATLEVPTVTLDSVPFPGRVALVKIDAEGAEGLVVRGAARFLAEHRPALLVEVNPEALAREAATTGAGLVSTLCGLGYRAHELEGSGRPVPLATATDERVVNVVFLQ